MGLCEVLDIEMEAILEWLEEHDDGLVRLLGLSWREFEISREHDFCYRVKHKDFPFAEYITFSSWKEAFEFAKIAYLTGVSLNES